MARITSNDRPASRSGEVLIEVQRRRRWTFVEKLRAAYEASAPGMSVSSVARKYGMAPSQLFRWRKVILDHSVESIAGDDQALNIDEVRELKRQVRELERLLGKKTLENEMMREVIVNERSKSGRVPITGKKELFSDV